MVKKNLTTAILFKDKLIIKKLIYLTFAKDGSLYISFPRKNGYFVESSKSLSYDHFTYKGYHKITLIKQKKEYINPKLSYHYSSSILHMTCFDGTILQSDDKTLNLSSNFQLIPLAEVLLPKSFDQFDDYGSNNYFQPLTIKFQEISNCLSLQFFMITKFVPIDLFDMPYINKMKKPSLYRFGNTNLKYDCLLLISQLNSTQHSMKDNGITIKINCDKKIYLYKIKPIIK